MAKTIRSQATRVPIRESLKKINDRTLELTARGRQVRYRPDRCRGRRQEPHADGETDRRDGQESEERCRYDKQ